MTLNEIQQITAVEGASGTTIGKGVSFCGSFFFKDMMKVENFQTQDWDSVLDNKWIKELSMVIGYKAYAINSVKNSVGIGNHSTITGHNVVQLGWTSQNVTTMNGYYNRSDKRDMASVQTLDSNLGLSFIKRLKPVSFKPIHRDEDFDEKFPYPHPMDPPVAPIQDDYYYVNNRGRKLFDQEAWDKDNGEYLLKLSAHTRYKERLNKAVEARQNGYTAADNVGTAKDEFRLGLVAKEVKSALAAAGLTGNYALTLEHKDQGLDVDYIAYDQFVPILVKALQEVTSTNDDLSTRVELLETSLVEMAESIATLSANVSAGGGDGVVGLDPSVGLVQISRYSGDNYQAAVLTQDTSVTYPKYNGYFNTSADTVILWANSTEETTVNGYKRRLGAVISIQVGWPKDTPVTFECNGKIDTVAKTSGDFKFFIYLDKEESASALTTAIATPFQMRVGGNVIISASIWHSGNTAIFMSTPWN